jgi:hypothetical protein
MDLSMCGQQVDHTKGVFLKKQGRSDSTIQRGRAIVNRKKGTGQPFQIRLASAKDAFANKF